MKKPPTDLRMLLRGALAGCLLSLRAGATNYTWDGEADSNWSAANNWNANAPVNRGHAGLERQRRVQCQVRGD
ncbi:MAG: hypothetical protein U1F77_18620 [Kiritimatiellia bacterium]